MAEVFWPFDSGPGADVTEAEWRQMATLWLGTGVVFDERDALEVYADASGMQVKVRAGKAWMEGHYYASDAEETLPIDTADNTDPRIDLVVVRADFTANTITTAVVKGTPAASPTLPALTQSSGVWEIPLASVSVPAGATTINAGDVTDRREPAQRVLTYEQESPTAPPSVYPHGVTMGLVRLEDGWPYTGMVYTMKRRLERVVQFLIKMDNSLNDSVVLARQGYTSGSIDGWSPWSDLGATSRAVTAFLSTAETTTSTVMTDLATVGPSVSVEVGPTGLLLVTASVHAQNTTASESAFMGFALSGTGSVAASSSRSFRANGPDFVAGSYSRLLTGLTRGDYTVTAKYAASAGTASFANREISAIPL